MLITAQSATKKKNEKKKKNDNLNNILNINKGEIEGKEKEITKLKLQCKKNSYQ